MQLYSFVRIYDEGKSVVGNLSDLLSVFSN